MSLAWTGRFAGVSGIRLKACSSGTRRWALSGSEASARKSRGIGMNVIGWNRTPRAIAGVQAVDLDALLAAADMISLHLALTDETRGLIDAERLARTKPGVILLNTARAALVEEDALLKAL